MSRRHLLVLLAVIALLPLPGRAEGAEILTGRDTGEIHLVFPQDAEATWFLDTFGAGRSGGRAHLGNDLHAPKGSPVYAVAPGIVTRMAISGRAGAYLVIDHGAGWTSWYMHLNTDEPGTDNGGGRYATAFAVGIEEGTFVDAGQVVGFVGDSGNAEHTVPHTHFELHRDGRAIDPNTLLVEAYERARLALHAQRLAAIEAHLS